MKNKLIKLTALSAVTASLVYGGGYRIPETSINAVALSAANVANSKGADASYYNPANMAFMDNKQSAEFNLMYVGLDATNFKGSMSSTDSTPVDIDAKSETFLIPSLNYVSNIYGDFRYGFSLVVPGGLTKRWSDSPALDSAEEFSLTVVELNPSVSYKVNKNLALAFGLRALHSEGVVKSSSTASRDMEGDSWDFGYNLALSYKPANNIDLALTYRSNVDLTEEGNAKLYIGNAKVYDGGASVTVPIPAVLNLAFAYTLPTKTTIEFVYERSFWSSYEDLDFDYKDSIPTLLQKPMDDPIAKDWEDVNAYRLGVTQSLNEYTLMAGIVYDQTPVPENKVTYELPDSDSLSVSFGGRYEIDKSLDMGLSLLYSMREDRDVKNDDIDGTFSNSNVILVSFGAGYKF
jgi:long-chain fatty acid transport protein